VCGRAATRSASVDGSMKPSRGEVALWRFNGLRSGNLAAKTMDSGLGPARRLGIDCERVGGSVIASQCRCRAVLKPAKARLQLFSELRKRAP
jgi:hypothetical protein